MFIGVDMPVSDWESVFETAPPKLEKDERSSWLAKLDKVALASDAFFPFRDNIDRAVQVCLKLLNIDFKKNN